MKPLMSLLTGVSAGVGLGLLIAPRSGRRIRSLIRRRANHSVRLLRQETAGIREAAAEVIRDGTRMMAIGTRAFKTALA